MSRNTTPTAVANGFFATRHVHTYMYIWHVIHYYNFGTGAVRISRRVLKRHSLRVWTRGAIKTFYAPFTQNVRRRRRSLKTTRFTQRGKPKRTEKRPADDDEESTITLHRSHSYRENTPSHAARSSLSWYTHKRARSPFSDVDAIVD